MNNDTNIADLLRTLRDEITTLVREEIALARTEISEKSAVLARNLAYLAIGGLIAVSALMLMLIGVSIMVGEGLSGRGINTGTAASLGFLIVAIIVGVVAASMVTKALKMLSTSTLKPNRTVRSLHEDKEWAQEKLS